MKYLLLVLVLISSSVSFNASANERQLIQELQSSNEPWAKDAMMSGPRHLYVGKYNLGTREDGYAAYTCQLAATYMDAKHLIVVIVDILPFVRNGKVVKLGQVWCRDVL
jgi:hypothetical protein